MSLKVKAFIMMALAVTLISAISIKWIEGDIGETIAAQVHARLKVVSEVQTKALATALWNYDAEQSDTLIKSMALDPDFLGSFVTDTKGKILLQYGQMGTDDNSILLESDINYTSQDNIRSNIGKLHLYISLNSINIIKEKLFIYFGISTLILLITKLLIVYFFLRQYSGPIESITNSMIELSGGNLDHHISGLERKDEIGKMANALDVFKETSKKAQEMTEIIKKQNEELKITSQAKSDFISNMSHELRTPMNAIVGMTDLALVSNLEQKTRGWLDMVKKSANLQMDLINNIVDVCKFDKKQMDLYHVPLMFNKIVEEVTDIFGLEAEAKGIELIIHYVSEAESPVIGDATKIKKTLVNLVGNAIKFTLQGHVLVKLDAKVVGEYICFKLTVEDTGIGIPDDKISTIFDKFSQADSGSNRKYGGMGLGLNMSQEMVKLMGGEIKVESTVDVGSKFYFELNLPLDKEKTNHQHKVDGYKIISENIIKDLRILVVDDNKISRELISEYLTTWNIKHDCLDQAQNSLDRMIKESENNDPYHIVLIDYRLPDFNGEILAKKIKSNESIKNSQLVLISAIANNLDNTKNLMNIGFASTISKPFHPSLLWAALNLVWKNREKPIFVTSNYIRNLISDFGKTKQDQVSFKDKKILVVDDVKMNQVLMQHILSRLGCEVAVAENGQISIDMSQATDYDLIFMDHQMPVMDGIEAVKRIRELEKVTKKHVPIITVTANATKEDRDMYLSAGMDEFMQKPIKSTEVINVMQRFLS
jgi:signal transduction histidine kinase/DNA-binding response OmpR family regulator